MAVELLTQSGYARHRRARGLPGGALNAVQEAIKARRITPIMQDGKVLIDPEVADIQWAKNTNHAKARHLKLAPAPAGAPGAAAATGAGAPPADGDPNTFMGWKTMREKHEAQLAEMKAQQMRGELLRADEVRRGVVGLLRTLRAGLGALPDRLAPLLAAEADPLRVRAMLKGEIDGLLAELVKTELAGAPAEVEG